MPSIELESLDRDGITIAASSARASIDTTGEDSAIRTSLSQSSFYSTRSSEPQQRRRQQPQHVNSSEHRIEPVPGEASEPPQQSSQQDQEEPEEEPQTGSTSQGQPQVSAQTAHQAADEIWLHRVTTQTLDLVKVVWEKLIKQRQPEIAIAALIIGILMISPTFGQYAQSLWSNAVTYQGWCKDEQAANHTLTYFCNLIVNRPMPPPPGLDKVFKDIGRRDSIPTIMTRTPAPSPPIWRTPTKEELEAAHAFINGPVGNGISFMIYGFFALMLRLEDESGKWIRFLFVFDMFLLLHKTTLVRAVANVGLLMDWCYWLRKIDVRSPSLGALAVMPILYGVGYMLEKSFTIQLIVSVISVLVVGDHYSHKLLPILQMLEQHQAATKKGA